MNIQFGRFRITLLFWPTVVAGVALGLLLGLGTWQMQRAAEKQRVLAEHRSKAQSIAIALHDDPRAPADSLHLHPVTALGTLDGERTMLLDNRIRDSVAGYEVLVPLRLQGSDVAVLVNRGWLARGAQRAVKPTVEHPPGEVRVVGVAVRPERSYRFVEMLETGSRWPHIVQFVAIDEMQTLVGYRLLPVVLRLGADDPLALRTGWPTVTIEPQRHYGYAVQWYGLAIALLVTYLAACTRRHT
ncbi:MAG: SURF1 family protein [Gammaproteobacteria bacterium]|nr:SURF1 family protein [Gammaproteobacteria bacterium]